MSIIARSKSNAPVATSAPAIAEAALGPCSLRCFWPNSPRSPSCSAALWPKLRSGSGSRSMRPVTPSLRTVSRMNFAPSVASFTITVESASSGTTTSSTTPITMTAAARPRRRPNFLASRFCSGANTTDRTAASSSALARGQATKPTASMLPISRMKRKRRAAWSWVMGALRIGAGKGRVRPADRIGCPHTPFQAERDRRRLRP